LKLVTKFVAPEFPLQAGFLGAGRAAANRAFFYLIAHNLQLGEGAFNTHFSFHLNHKTMKIKILDNFNQVWFSKTLCILSSFHFRLRRRKSKTRKYGVLSTAGQDNMEMTPLDQEEEDEDMTVFELNGHARK
jgi:hypothetical protein